VLVMHYLPWCQFCKKLKPIIVQLAQAFAAQPSAVIAQVNTEANDVPTAVETDAFPAMFFWPAGSSAPLALDESIRSFKDIASFVVKNSKTGLTMPPEPPKAEKKPTKDKEHTKDKEPPRSEL